MGEPGCTNHGTETLSSNMELAPEKTQKCSFGTLVGCEEAVRITLPGSKGHQDSTLSQQKEAENMKQAQ